MNADVSRLNRLSERTIGCAFTVANALGIGFLEKVYENSLAHELRKYGLQVEQQRGVAVLCDGVVVGDYTVDLLVEESLIIELKTVRILDDVHRAQCMNYLRAANLHLCLLLNFNRPRVQVERIVWRLPEDR